MLLPYVFPHVLLTIIIYSKLRVNENQRSLKFCRKKTGAEYKDCPLISSNLYFCLMDMVSSWWVGLGEGSDTFYESVSWTISYRKSTLVERIDLGKKVCLKSWINDVLNPMVQVLKLWSNATTRKLSPACVIQKAGMPEKPSAPAFDKCNKCCSALDGPVHGPSSLATHAEICCFYSLVKPGQYDYDCSKDCPGLTEQKKRGGRAHEPPEARSGSPQDGTVINLKSLS